MKLLVYRFVDAAGATRTALVFAGGAPSAQRDEFLEDAVMGLPGAALAAEVDLGDFDPAQHGIEVFHPYTS